MATGTQGLMAELQRQAETVNEGAYHTLLMTLQQLATDRPEVLAPLEVAWCQRPFHAWYDRPLLLLASLRFLALGDRQHPLYPELVTNTVVSEVQGRLAEALADPTLGALLSVRRVQTNEPGRALGWALVAMLLKPPLRGWALADLGTSAGLNLVGDLTPIRWRVGTQLLTGLDVPSPGARWGLDIAPLDLRDKDALRWVRACVWPGETERIQRLDDATRALLRPWQERPDRPILRPHTLGTEDTAAILRPLDEQVDGPIMAFQSLVQDYLDDDHHAAHTTTMNRWLLDDRRHLWVRFEPTEASPPSTPMLLEVAFAREGQVISLPLARSRYHPTGCVVLPAGLDQFRNHWAP